MGGIFYATYFPAIIFFPRNQSAGYFVFSEITHNLPNGNLCQFSVKPYVFPLFFFDLAYKFTVPAKWSVSETI